MKYAAIVVFSLLNSMAWADGNVDPRKEYTLTLTGQELLVIAGAVGGLPYNNVAAIVSKLSKQVDDQNKPDDKK